MEEFDLITPENITSGRATDAYFARTEEALDEAGVSPHVVAEVTADQFPTGEFEVFAGIKDVAVLFEDIPVTIDALREGQLFDGGPVLRIEGGYRDFARYETALLGFLSHASGMATAALETRRTAPDDTVLSFGARHVHPSLGAMVERSALVGGLDGFSNVAAGDVLGREAGGTMPHALMHCFGRGNQESAWRAFNDGVPDTVPRIALCDTYTDETDEVRRALQTFGDDLDGVRLDTTGSRRGDFRHIIKEVQWLLSEEGRDDVDIFVSGGLGPDDIVALRDLVDGFGVGGYISNADQIDFSLDIVEVDGEPITKRGKLFGMKDVYRMPDGEHRTVGSEGTATNGEKRAVNGEALLRPLVDDGEVVRDFDIEGAATLAQQDADAVDFDEQIPN